MSFQPSSWCVYDNRETLALDDSFKWALLLLIHTHTHTHTRTHTHTHTPYKNKKNRPDANDSSRAIKRNFATCNFAGAQFSCFTSTKVQVLTQQARWRSSNVKVPLEQLNATSQAGVQKRSSLTISTPGHHHRNPRYLSFYLPFQPA